MRSGSLPRAKNSRIRAERRCSSAFRGAEVRQAPEQRRRHRRRRAAVCLCADDQLDVELQIRDALRVDGLLRLHRAQHVAHDVDGLEQQVEIADVTCMRLPRSSSSSVSRLCVNEAISLKPNVALPPLMECATRKIVLMSSGIRRAEIELEERRLHRVERFEALFEEGVVKLSEVQRHAQVRPRIQCCGETEQTHACP